MSHRIHLFKGKLHRATVTHADLDYEGSVTIAADLLDATGIVEHEQVHVWNVTRGTRLVTYALRGDAGSGIVCINGAAAHLARPGDKVIIATFAEVEAEAAAGWEPTVVLVDDDNRIVGVGRRGRRPAAPHRRRLSARPAPPLTSGGPACRRSRSPPCARGRRRTPSSAGPDRSPGAAGRARTAAPPAPRPRGPASIFSSSGRARRTEPVTVTRLPSIIPIGAVARSRRRGRRA